MQMNVESVGLGLARLFGMMWAFLVFPIRTVHDQFRGADVDVWDVLSGFMDHS